ncbi:MAG TPA: hypothetical protein VNO79_02655 [Actinomycetota bacterium]|nr:hypothetical protein [Actinomycetota bacterium]
MTSIGEPLRREIWEPLEEPVPSTDPEPAEPVPSSVPEEPLVPG